MIDLDNTPFGTALISPDRKRFIMVDAGTDDAGASFAWLVPVNGRNVATGRRKRLYFGEANGWATLAQARLNLARYTVFLRYEVSDSETVAFDASDDARAKSHALELATARNAADFDLHRVRPQSEIAADEAAGKTCITLSVRVP